MNKTEPFLLPNIPPEMSKGALSTQSMKFANDIYSSFLSSSADEAIKKLETTPSEVWEREGEKNALKLFHAAAERVPAYKDFLKKHKIQHEKITNIEEYKNVPLLEKDNYLREYPLKDISWDGNLHNSQIISVSSGSTGTPFFWPRGIISELETTAIFEIILKNFFEADKKSTLFVNAFAMGMYVGGPITLNSTLRIAHKGYPITIVTPGYSLEDIHRVVHELGPQHEQVVIASYPPFAKDIIDDGIEKGIKWKKMSVKFLLAGEGFSEGWRSYIASAVKADPINDVITLYGTADAAILGHETIASNTLRRAFGQSTATCSSAFGEDRLPSLLQYYPSQRYFELVDDELVLTASAGVPLLRYNIHDRGGVMSYGEAMKRFNKVTGEKAEEENDKKFWKLPFVYLFGRSDFTTVFYGANIYPENIKSALEVKEVSKLTTGKFTMFTDNDKRQNQQLIVNIECKKNVKPSPRIKRIVEKAIVKKLLEVNSEYGVVYKSRKKKAKPQTNLYCRGDKEFFGDKGVKQTWTFKGGRKT